jgi:hypothetical protein
VEAIETGGMGMEVENEGGEMDVEEEEE